MSDVASATPAHTAVTADVTHGQTAAVANGPLAKEVNANGNGESDHGVAQGNADNSVPIEPAQKEPLLENEQPDGNFADPLTTDPQPDASETQPATAEPSDDDDDPFAGLDDLASMDLYELSNYTFGKKNEESKSRMWKDQPRLQTERALERNYKEKGLRRSVGAVMLVHSKNFPHLLLLQRSDGKGEYALPGGRLRPGESDASGLQRKLTSKLMPQGGDEDSNLDIGEKLATFYDLDFTRNYFPYIPRHLGSAREQLNVYVVSLPGTFAFAVPNNLQLVAVPIMEMFNDPQTYGNVIAAIPALLSRYHVNLC